MVKIASAIVLSGLFILSPAYADETPETTEQIEETIEETKAIKETTTQQETDIQETQPVLPTETTQAVKDEDLLQNSGSAQGQSEMQSTVQSTQPAMTDGAVSEDDIVIPSDNVQDMEEEKKRLEEEQKKNQELVDSKKEELASLNKELSEALAKINELDVKASDISAKMYETGQKLDASNKEKDEQYGDMKKRIQFMYENAENNLLEAVFSSKDMAEALNAAGYYQQIYDYDRDKLENFKQLVDNISNLQKEQEAELAEIEKLKEETDIEKAKLEVFIAEKQGDIDALTKIITEGEEGIATLDQNILDALNRMANEASTRAVYQGNAEALLKIAESAQEQALKEGKANAKMVAVARNAGRGISTFPLTYGWCAAWVSGVYNITGGITPPRGNAIDYWNKWKSSGSTRMDNVPIGACVISSGDPTYGHIGIYLGGGVVASNLGYCKIETIESFGNVPAVCQGHRGYIGWVWPNGQSLI